MPYRDACSLRGGHPGLPVDSVEICEVRHGHSGDVVSEECGTNRGIQTSVNLERFFDEETSRVSPVSGLMW